MWEGKFNLKSSEVTSIDKMAKGNITNLMCIELVFTLQSDKLMEFTKKNTDV
jgi:hypothetical protein